MASAVATHGLPRSKAAGKLISFAHGKSTLRSGELSGGYGSTQKVAQLAWCERHG